MEKSTRKAAPRKAAATTTKPRRPAAKKSSTEFAPVIELDHAAIAARAYALFERSGHTHGRDIEFWLEAERELRRKA